MSRGVDDVDTVLVVVPAHNEQALLGGCLAAMQLAVTEAAARGIRCLVRVVLDDCTDDSARIARGFAFPALRIAERRVGAARSAGIADGLAALPLLDERRTWIANTDADSQVPPHWITTQVDAARQGADVFLGTVRPDVDEFSPAHRRHWLRTHPLGHAPGNTHGANLGVRVSTYRAAGGFDAVAEHEDALLVERARAIGARLHASAAGEVRTSGRLVGRTPGGYAAFVRSQAAQFGSAVDAPASAAS